MTRKPQIAVVGPGGDLCTRAEYDFAFDLGKRLVDEGMIIICGGMGGVMEAVCEGARVSQNYNYPSTVGLTPFADEKHANPFIDIRIPTGIGAARNFIVANAGDVMVVIGGGAGTLAEIAFAWKIGKPIIAVTGVPGASAEWAGKSIDDRKREKILAASNVEEVVEQLKEQL